ncbi:hypothetical protein IEQ34_017450 [Dendrobium chrysotoxum]|uniref:Uncharacterized protein n=1 Tax=Dendrobium chrysotoxum TaxID=161865 RepID=A0AAV7GA83_DENCH|nr:hypothetical protein IEQ34_017450 [Dendrobium chrysotoxum]
MNNDWGLIEKWEKMKDLPGPLQVGEEDILRFLNVPDIEHLLYGTLIAEKEAALFGLESSRVVEDFKKSISFKIIIQDRVQEAHDHIYDVEVKDLEVQVKGLTLSHASNDSPIDFDGDEIESELLPRLGKKLKSLGLPTMLRRACMLVLDNTAAVNLQPPPRYEERVWVFEIPV